LTLKDYLKINVISYTLLGSCMLPTRKKREFSIDGVGEGGANAEAK
jgi:hypothetical protein